MAATSGYATPIRVYRSLNGGASNPTMRRLAEKASQTFLDGVPVQVEVASGYIIEAAAMTNVATAFIAGISNEPAANLTSSGVAKTLTYGSVQNQSSAVLIPAGAPPNDGTTGFDQAVDMVTFVGSLGGSTTDADGTSALTDVGAIFGLTKDAGNKYWYVDKDKTTTALGACVQVVGLIDPAGTLHGKVEFKILHAAQQLSGN